MIDLLNNFKIRNALERAVMATGLDYAVDAPDKEDVLGMWITFKNSENFVQSETDYLLAEIDRSPHIEREDSPHPGPSTSHTYPEISHASAHERRRRLLVCALCGCVGLRLPMFYCVLK
jgi:hypothetical protein